MPCPRFKDSIIFSWFTCLVSIALGVMFLELKICLSIIYPANMQDRANVGHQLAGLAKRRQNCQRFANVANVLPISLQTP